MFATVIAGIDSTRFSFEAGRQAARLVSPGGRLLLVSAVDAVTVSTSRWGAERIRLADDRSEDAFATARERIGDLARRGMERLRAQLPAELGVELRVEAGRPWDALRRIAVEEGAGLVVTGSQGRRRIAGIALGSTATDMLHGEGGSVMVARTAFDPGNFPASVVVGVDGSEHSIAALDAVTRWRESAVHPVSVRVVTARGSGVSAAALRRLAGPFDSEVRDEKPVDALVGASAGADLLVVGARGTTGVRALGSVSERVAHRAECSVLVRGAEVWRA